MHHFAIGTTSRYKVNAIQKALFELDFELKCTPVEVESGISSQPHETAETLRGSRNRAINALSIVTDATAGIGVEFGYEPRVTQSGHNKTYHMLCWASIITLDGAIFSEHSSSLELPTSLVKALEEGLEISDNLELATKNLEDIEHNRIFIQYLKKRRFIYESVTTVGMRYLLAQKLYD